jgi:hypothetical protein
MDNNPPNKMVAFNTTMFVICTILLYLTPFLIINFSYFIPAKQWNDNVMLTTGSVMTHTTHTYVVHYSCNCVRHCTGYKHHCTTTCDTCDRYCYKCTIKIGYDTDSNETDTVDNVTSFPYIVTTQPYTECYYSRYNAEHTIDENYPIGSNVTVYYNKDDPTQYRLKVTPNYLTAEICGICIPMGIFILSIVSGTFCTVYRKIKKSSVKDHEPTVNRVSVLNT